MINCVFCERFIPKEKPLFENKLALAYFDENPISRGHIFLITRRHAKTFFDTTTEEQHAMIDLLNQCKKYLDEEYKPTGYNVGLNCEEDAGQTVMHVHMHLIPRYKGDVENPRGGIRCVIPEKQNY